MQKVPFRNLSLLGLVLMGASAVTAAVMPKDKQKAVSQATLVTTSSPALGAGEQTCDPTNRLVFECTVSEGTVSSAGGDTSDIGTVDVNDTTDDLNVNSSQSPL